MRDEVSVQGILRSDETSPPREPDPARLRFLAVTSSARSCISVVRRCPAIHLAAAGCSAYNRATPEERCKARQCPRLGDLQQPRSPVRVLVGESCDFFVDSSAGRAGFRSTLEPDMNANLKTQPDHAVADLALVGWIHEYHFSRAILDESIFSDGEVPLALCIFMG